MKLLFLAILTVACHAQGVKMLTQRVSISPDLRWQVRCVTRGKETGGIHSILLSRFGGKGEVPIYEFDRDCDIVWSADGRQLAINDWLGSSVSDVYILETSAPKARKIEISNLLAIVSKEETEGHCYYEALKWESENKLAMRVFGHTDENPSHGFCYYLLVDTLSQKAALVRKENREPNQALLPTTTAVTPRACARVAPAAVAADL